MDHIIKPGNGWPQEVPYIFDDDCPYVFDNENWSKFPERMGWTSNELINSRLHSPGEIPEHTVHRAASLMQAWFFFGLISLLTGTDVNTDKYVEVNSGSRRIVTTKYLPFQLEIWRQRLLRMSEEDSNDCSKSWDRLVQLMDRRIQMAVVHAKEGVLPLEVNFSISILFRTLIVFKKMIFPTSKLPREIIHPHCRDKLAQVLFSKGWSECDMSQFGQNFSQLTLYYIGSTMDNGMSGDHSKCNGQICEILQKSDNQIIPRHASDGCQCQQALGPPEELLISVIQKNLLPVLSYSEDLGLTVDSNPLDGEVHQPYIAISHVWSHGLGNPNSNEMRVCQLKSIQKKVSALARKLEIHSSFVIDQNMPFWIDTLCVPAKQCPEKDTAITAMDKIYSNASAVLVLDPYLELVGEPIPVALQAVSISSASWFTRLWTIQEGALAKQLFFQLKQDAIAPFELLSACRSYYSSIDFSLLWSAEKVIVAECLKPLRELSIENIRSYQGRYILSHLRWRFTSQEADETICLAILLGFCKDYIECLLQLPKHGFERMAKFLLMQKHLPSDLVFWPEPLGPGHQASEGFSWAPTTFLSRRSSAMIFMLRDPYWDFENLGIENDDGFVDETGFHVKYPGISLDLIYYTEESKRIVEIFFQELDMVPGATSMYGCILLSEETPNLTWDRFPKPGNLAILLPQELSAEEGDGGFPERIGLLVEMRSSQEGEQLCYRKNRVL